MADVAASQKSRDGGGVSAAVESTTLHSDVDGVKVHMPLSLPL
jgi:hypothetical protein